MARGARQGNPRTPGRTHAASAARLGPPESWPGSTAPASVSACRCCRWCRRWWRTELAGAGDLRHGYVGGDAGGTSCRRAPSIISSRSTAAPGREPSSTTGGRTWWSGRNPSFGQTCLARSRGGKSRRCWSTPAFRTAPFAAGSAGPASPARPSSPLTWCWPSPNSTVSALPPLAPRTRGSPATSSSRPRPLPADPAALAQLARDLQDRPRWLAASIHPGEDAIGRGHVHRTLRSKHPGLLTIVVPRHPDRGPAMAAALIARGLSVACRSQGQTPEAGTDIYLADTMGELGPVLPCGRSGVHGQIPGSRRRPEPRRAGAAGRRRDVRPRHEQFPRHQRGLLWPTARRSRWRTATP